jgi:hypothetical protein
MGRKLIQIAYGNENLIEVKELIGDLEDLPEDTNIVSMGFDVKCNERETK